MALITILLLAASFLHLRAFIDRIAHFQIPSEGGCNLAWRIVIPQYLHTTRTTSYNACRRLVLVSGKARIRLLSRNLHLPGLVGFLEVVVLGSSLTL